MPLKNIFYYFTLGFFQYNCPFFGQSLGRWHYFSIYQPQEIGHVFCRSVVHPLSLKLVYITNYLAVSSSSLSEGSLRESIIPRFILAGSSAQFDRPMKATRENLSSVSMTSSSLLSLSSKRGCKVFRGILGESSASPTSSSTTTEVNLSKHRFLLSSGLEVHCIVGKLPVSLRG